MEWNKENTLYFIQLIRERPVLWDVTLEEHKDKNKKLDALSDIAKIFRLTKEEVNSKWTSLKGQYNREKKQVTGLKTGSGAADIYISKWFAYQEMASLLSCNIPQESISNYAISPPPPPTLPTPSPPAMPVPPPTTPTPPPTTPTPPPITSTPLRGKGSDAQKKKRNSGLYGEALLTLKAIREKRNKTPEQEDEITTYGLYIAAQMRKFNAISQSKLKLDIQSLLCKYELENIECTRRSTSSMSDNSAINTLYNDGYSSGPSSPIESSSTYRQMPTTSLAARTCTYTQPKTESMPTSFPIASTSTYEQPEILTYTQPETETMPSSSPIASTSTYEQHEILTYTQPETESMPTSFPIASTSTYEQPNISLTTATTSPTARYFVISSNGKIIEVTGNQPDSPPHSNVVILQNDMVLCPDADTSQIETNQAIENLLKYNKK